MTTAENSFLVASAAAHHLSNSDLCLLAFGSLEGGPGSWAWPAEPPAAHAAGSAQPVKRRRAQGKEPVATGGGHVGHVNTPAFDAEVEGEEEDNDEYWARNREIPEFDFDMF